MNKKYGNEFGNKYGETYSLELSQNFLRTSPPGDTVVVNQPLSNSGRYDINAGLPRTHPIGPPSLEYLSMIDQLIVHQKVEMLEVLCGCETRNKYKIKNSMGQEIYKAIEDSTCCDRFCCGKIRQFDMKIVDHTDSEVMHLYRPLRCIGCCFPCCPQRLEVYAPPNNLVGIVAEEWSFCDVNLSVRTPDGNVIFRIIAPCCQCRCCSDIEFPIYDEESGETIGKITKQWSGLGRELYTDADHFGITFPLELEISKKAALVGALFLIDFMYFENQNHQ